MPQRVGTGGDVAARTEDTACDGGTSDCSVDGRCVRFRFLAPSAQLPGHGHGLRRTAEPPWQPATIRTIWTASAQPYCWQHTHRASYKSVKRMPHPHPTLTGPSTAWPSCPA